MKTKKIVLRTIRDVEKWVAFMLFSDNGLRPQLEKAVKDGDMEKAQCYRFGAVLLTELLNCLEGDRKDA